MEIAVAVGACLSVPLMYSVVRTRMKTKVNCWFCNTDSKVDYANRNSFICPSCEQYNGFNSDGDYNQKIPAQSYTTPVRYCKPSSSHARNRPDLIPERFGNLNMSPKQENGLCSQCNRNQEIIMRKVADFEPVDEDRWNEELEDYRYKLERMYQLCPRCTISVHGKLEEDKKKYSYLFEVRHKLKHAIGSTINQFINPKSTRSRRYFFSGGLNSEMSRSLTLVLSASLFFANIHFLQEDAGVDLIELPKWSSHMLPKLYENSALIHFIILITHIVACVSNKCRTTLPDLLVPIILMISGITYFLELNGESEDMALVRCACSSFLSILGAAASFIPRKKLHKKRPNKIISSAFSVASTPLSQCSSQDSRNVTLLEESKFPKVSPFDRKLTQSPLRTLSQNHISQLSPSHSRWREREQTPVIETRSPRRNAKENNETMDWEDTETVSQRSAFRPSILAQAARLRGLNNKESTPARELAPSVASMSLFGDRDERPSSSLSFRTARPLASNGTAFTKINSPARSAFTPRTVISHEYERPIFGESNTRTGSVFTSISQQDRNSIIGSEWQCRVIVIMFSLIFVVLLLQIVLFYILLRK